MQAVLNDPAERDLRIFQIPTSGIKQNGQKLNYFDFISGLSDPDCNRALKRILPRIDMGQIYELIDNTPYITDLQKQFYKTILSERKEKILDKSFQLLKSRECRNRAR